MPKILAGALGHPSRTLEGNSRKRSKSVSGVFSEIFQSFLSESPSRTGGVAYKGLAGQGELGIVASRAAVVEAASA